MAPLLIKIQRWLMQAHVWRFVGLVSAMVGLVCYALSSSFNHLLGGWNFLKIFVYSVFSIIICLVILFAKEWQQSGGFRFKAHMAFFFLTITSVSSFFFDKAATGGPDTYDLISCAAFAVTSLSFSRLIQYSSEVDPLYFFLGTLIVQLMKIRLLFGLVGVVFSYSLVILHSSLDAASEIEHLRFQDQHSVVVQVDSNSQQANNNNAFTMPQLTACIEALKADDWKRIAMLSKVLKNDGDVKRLRAVASGSRNESRDAKVEGSDASSGKPAAQSTQPQPDPPKQDYNPVRARSGEAADSHSLAERARREKISERMRILQDLVPGCNKVIGKVSVLDEIINYVQSLQRQVEFLSMKLEAVNSRLNSGIEAFPPKDNDGDVKRLRAGASGSRNESRDAKVEGAEASSGKLAEQSTQPLPDPPKQDYIHVQARRGQATGSHSPAERARREKINERMRILQDLVPGCNKVIGKALVLDEIINYIQSLQRQVEFLSMKLEAVNSRLSSGIEAFPPKDFGQQTYDPAGMPFGSQAGKLLESIA